MQSAYKAAHSTETALLRITNDVLSDLDDKKGVVLVLLDLSAAFDTIDHRLLLERLHVSLGISGTVLAWFSSYLSSRTNSIFINNQCSSPSEIEFGVPQGSVLGPILFTIYTKPLSSIISSFGLKYHFYADDTQIYISFETNNSESFDDSLSKVEGCVKAVKNWMSVNMLKLNDEKTEVLFITSSFYQKSLRSCSLLVDQTPVSPSKSARNIGVVFDDKMQMNSHINSICKTAHFHLRKIGTIRKYLTQDACATLVHSVISSRLDYCNSLLAELPSSSYHKLQRVLNTAARIVSLRPKREPITPVLRSLHWLPVKQRVVFKVLLLVFRCVHGTAPSYLCDILKTRSITSHMRLRSSNEVILKHKIPRTRYGARAFSVCGPILWNKLPSEIKIVQSYSSFKNKLKTLLFKEAFF